MASNRRSTNLGTKEDLFQPRQFGLTTGPQHLSRHPIPSISVQIPLEPRRLHTSISKVASPNNVEDGAIGRSFDNRVSTAISPKRLKADNILPSGFSPARIRAERVRPATMHRSARRSISGMLSRSMPEDELQQKLGDQVAAEQKDLSRARWYAINYVQRMQENALCAKFMNQPQSTSKS